MDAINIIGPIIFWAFVVFWALATPQARTNFAVMGAVIGLASMMLLAAITAVIPAAQGHT